MIIYVCMYVCIPKQVRPKYSHINKNTHECMHFTVKLKYPCCCFAEPPALIPLECSLNVDVEVELTYGTRLGMYGKALGYNLDF